MPTYHDLVGNLAQAQSVIFLAMSGRTNAIAQVADSSSSSTAAIGGKSKSRNIHIFNLLESNNRFEAIRYSGLRPLPLPG